MHTKSLHVESHKHIFQEQSAAVQGATFVAVVVVGCSSLQLDIVSPWPKSEVMGGQAWLK